ncbi:MAG: hypothetical protein PHP42_04015 [Bacteroidota bacterium]|nr:hypothetical protein [Bacteroidota bacterium]
MMIGCIDDVPHDNPLDPLSPSFKKIGSLSGHVIIANQTTGVAGADISAIDDGISVTTDSLGNFSFVQLSTGTHRFVCTKQNFSNDTFSVNIQSGVSSQVLRSLNGAPIVLSQKILTRKIDQYFPSPEYFVEIAANVTDPNGFNDLVTVWFAADTLRFPMSYSPTSRNFEATLLKSNFPTNTIQWLVGKPLHIISRDTNNAVNISDPFFVTRVIENGATPTDPSPFNNDTIKISPFSFNWTPPNVTFNYTYTLTVSRIINAGIQSVVWTNSGIHSLTQTQQYPPDGSTPLLQPGNYVWTISVVDDFGNYARSKESSFVVQ